MADNGLCRDLKSAIMLYSTTSPGFRSTRVKENTVLGLKLFWPGFVKRVNCLGRVESGRIISTASHSVLRTRRVGKLYGLGLKYLS